MALLGKKRSSYEFQAVKRCNRLLPVVGTALSCVIFVSSSIFITDMCIQMPSREATDMELLQVHTADHLKSLQAFCSGVECGVRIPSDTYVNEHTLKCATLAAGSAAQAAVAVATGKASCAAAIVRPPGESGKVWSYERRLIVSFCFESNLPFKAGALLGGVQQARGALRRMIEYSQFFC
jgi:hypothetical protein